VFATYFSAAELTQVRSVFDDSALIYELKHVMVSARSRTSKAAPASLFPAALCYQAPSCQLSQQPTAVNHFWALPTSFSRAIAKNKPEQIHRPLRPCTSSNNGG